MAYYPLLIENDANFDIALIKARQIIDSRGNPTIEVEVVTEGNGVGRAAAPAGASKGKFEAIEKRDASDKRFLGKGVFSAVELVNTEVAEALIGMDSRKQWEIDKKIIELDGTPNKSRLGANATIATSLAVAKAAADTYGLPLFRYIGGLLARVLPVPLMNIINGGKHAGNELAIQEFMIVPAGTDSFSEALRMGCEVYYALKDLLKSEYGKSAINVGDEGGFAPPMRNTREALDMLVKAIEKAGYSSDSIALALDAAASSFYDEDKKRYRIDGKELTREELIDFYEELINEYPIISIEDPLHEEDFEGFSQITKKLGKKILIVGDDLFVTNKERLLKGINVGAANAILVKPNQIGTLSETIEVVELAKREGYRTIMSHRSGETEDTTIADLAVGLATGIIKTGAPARGERTAKYNQLLRIEEILGSEAIFLGFKVFPKKPV
ncbi:MAG: phosphopyruvate hydratase [Candidatus Njordarchaeales archaeon]